MEKKPWKLVNAENVEAYACDESYSSKMLTGDEMAGMPVININEGTLKPFSRTAGGEHDETEIYCVLDCGEPSYVVLDGEFVNVKNGDVILIPPHVFHWIDNTSCDRPFRLFTFWPRQEQNSVFFARQRAWGTSVRNLDADYAQKRLKRHASN